MDAGRYQKIKKIFSQATEISVAARGEFLRKSCDDSAMRREIEKMLVFADDETDDALEKNAFEIFAGARDFKLPERIGNYKIVREIGRGGMGAVYEAVRESRDFRQRAALKIIKRGMDTDAILSRFRQEQKILASLEHPHIARFLDGGVTDDGLPFYAMEYVEGEFIDDYCREKNLSVEERLKLFRQVCAAVLYAHQNLVVHRDLKPSNILVTPDGTPKLLDFGIGKILAPGADEAEIGTATQLGMMTPAYASPEQIRGARIGTSSDVYSLGVVLYELLTGQKPYRLSSKSNLEIERAVLESEPPRPSEINSKLKSQNSKTEARNSEFGIPNPKSLKGDLDNIILKALRKDAAQRYASVGQFSEDVRRYLEGKPVIARPQTFSYRAAKFIKRNQAAAAAAALVFLSLCAGITVAVWQAREARAARLRAENRFAEVRALANNVIFKYHDAIADLPGATATREMLVRDALKYLDNLSIESADNPELQRELARAYQKLGDVQGKQYGANLGDTAGAVESYRKAAALLEAVVAAGKADRETEFELVSVYESLFAIYMRTGGAERFEILNKALTLDEKLVAAEPENLKYKMQNLRLLILQGDAKTVAEKLPVFEKALPIGETLFAANPSDKEIVRQFMRVNQRLGSTYIWLGNEAKTKNDAGAAAENYAHALAFHQKAAALAARLVALDPQNVSFKRNYAIGANNLAEAFAKNKKRAETLAMMNKGLEIFAEMANADPRNTEIKLDIAFARETVAEMWKELGELMRAAEEREKAAAAHLQIWREDRSNGEALKGLRENHDFAAQLYRQIGDAAKAEYHERKVGELENAGRAGEN
jgi:eukaryotic-like serine/threonine-protein kinase